MGVPEEGLEHPVDVVDGFRRDGALDAELAEEVDEVPGANVLQSHVTDVRKDVVTEAGLIRPQVRDESLALLQPALGVAGQGDGALLGLPELYVGGEPVLQAPQGLAGLLLLAHLKAAGALRPFPIRSLESEPELLASLVDAAHESFRIEPER